MTKELLSTKCIVPGKHVKTFEKRLFKHGFGYELNLGIEQISMNFSKKHPIAFFIDYSGKIEFIENFQEEDVPEFRNAPEEEINWEFYYDGFR